MTDRIPHFHRPVKFLGDRRRCYCSSGVAYCHHATANWRVPCMHAISWAAAFPPVSHPFRPFDRPRGRGVGRLSRDMSKRRWRHDDVTLTTCTSGDWRQRRMMDERCWWIFSWRPVSSSPPPTAAAAAAAAVEPLSIGHVNTMKLLTSLPLARSLLDSSAKLLIFSDFYWHVGFGTGRSTI